MRLIGATHDTRYRHGWSGAWPITARGPCLTNALDRKGTSAVLGNRPYIRSYRNGPNLRYIPLGIPTRLGFSNSTLSGLLSRLWAARKGAICRFHARAACTVFHRDGGIQSSHIYRDGYNNNQTLQVKHCNFPPVQGPLRRHERVNEGHHQSHGTDPSVASVGLYLTAQNRGTAGRILDVILRAAVYLERQHSPHPESSSSFS